MTWRTWMWRGRFLAWFVVLMLPMLLMLIPVNLMEGSLAERITGNTVMVGAFVLLVSFHSWIRIERDRVRLGFFPLYWKTLAANEVKYAIRVEFSPMRDFAGWGIKGMAKSRNGILLGGNPAKGIMIETHDKRRYVLSFVEPDPILHALAAQGVTVSEVPLVDDDSDPELS